MRAAGEVDAVLALGCGCDRRLVDDLTEPPKRPRRDLMDIGPADAEAAGDFVGGQIGAISQREHLPLAGRRWLSQSSMA